MRSNDYRNNYKQGDVVYFHHLHTGSKDIKHQPQRSESDRWWCLVEGKARRMIIFRTCWRFIVNTAQDTGVPSGNNECVLYHVESQNGYLVLSLQSKLSPNFYDAGDILNEKQRSYVSLLPVCYTPEMISHGRCQEVKKIDKTIMHELTGLIARAALGMNLANYLA